MARMLDCGTCPWGQYTCSPENPHGHLCDCPMWGQDGCTQLANCHCAVCLPVDAPGTVPCPRCGDPMPEGRLAHPALADQCSVCTVHDIREAKRIEREMRVATFGEGRC